MKKISLIIFSVFFYFSVSAQENTMISLAFINYLKKDNYKQPYTYFDKTITDKLSIENLEAVWTGLSTQVGAYKGNNGTSSKIKDSIETVIVKGQFDSGNLDIKFVFNAKHKIIGFFFLPPKEEVKAYKEPGYENKRLYKEQDIFIKIKDSLKLPGKLVLPKQSKKIPVVIFVQGSGPSDMDESVGGAKLFRDLAVGLSNYGIGSVRYDKRTKVYPEQFLSKTSITVEDEVIEDVAVAINFAKKLEGADTTAIYLIGHSLGGMLAPRINKQKPELKGIVLMGANARPLEDLLLEQFTYIYSLNGLTENEKSQLNSLAEQVKKVKTSLNIHTPANELPLGLPASYWIDLNSYNQVKELAALKDKVFILQGERDYQVTMEDYQAWKKGLSNRENVIYKSYPLLNHMFIEGVGKSIPAEYQKQGNVPEYVVKDISDWILQK